MTRDREEDGFVLLTLFVTLVPLMFVVGAYSVAMTGQSNELRTELAQERALMAAEAGVDEALYRGQIGTLADGVVFTRILGSDLEYEVVPTYLGADTIDNDGDSNVDEADEDVFQVVVTGKFRRSERVVAAYLGRLSLLPPINTAFGTMSPSVTVNLMGTPWISGNNVTMAGAAAAPDVEGLSILDPPGTAYLSSELSPLEESKVTGSSPAPSLGVLPPFNLANLVVVLENAANIVLTSKKYTSYKFGNGIAGVANIAFRNGDVTFAGNSQGAGILVVTGDLTLTGTFRFDGLIIVLGDVVNSSGTANVFGAIIQGPAASLIETKGTMNVRYSAEAIALADSLKGRYVSFNGWQELAN